MATQSEAHGNSAPLSPAEDRAIEKLLNLLSTADEHLHEVSCALIDADEPAGDLPEDYPFVMQDDLESLRDQTQKLWRRVCAVHARLHRWAEGSGQDQSTIGDARFHEAREDGRI